LSTAGCVFAIKHSAGTDTIRSPDVIAGVIVAIIARRARQSRATWYTLAIDELTGANTIVTEGIIAGCAIGIIARTAGLPEDRRARVQDIADAIAIAIGNRCANTSASGIEHVTKGAGVTIITGFAHLTERVRAVIQ